MKVIGFSYGISFKASKAGEKIQITPELHADLQAIRKNRLHVIEAALLVESRVDQILETYFFGIPQKAVLVENWVFDYTCPRPEVRRKEFSAQILGSQWCTFAAKLKMLDHAIVDAGCYTKKEAVSLIDLLRKTMHWRNAFTHGQIVYQGGGFYLEYFRDQPRSDLLNDDFILKVQAGVREALDAIAAVPPPLALGRAHVAMRQEVVDEDKYAIEVDGQGPFVVDLTPSPKCDDPV